MQDFYIYFQNTNRFVIKISFLSRYRPIYPPFSLILRNFRIFPLDLDASVTSVKIIFSTFFVIFCFNTLLITIYQKKTEFGDYHYHDPSGSYRQCLLRLLFWVMVCFDSWSFSWRPFVLVIDGSPNVSKLGVIVVHHERSKELSMRLLFPLTSSHFCNEIIKNQCSWRPARNFV